MGALGKKKRKQKLIIIGSAKYRGAQVSIKDTESLPLVGTDNLKLNKFIFRKNYLSQIGHNLNTIMT